MSQESKKSREQLIEELVELKAGKVSAGICGREWCERCGQLGNFTGSNGALGSHLDHNRFTCWGCRTGETEAARESKNQRLDELILERGFRHCGGCGCKVELAFRTVKEARRLPFACSKCISFDRGIEARRRYIEHKAHQIGGLEETTARLRWAKAEIERILSDADDAQM